MPLDDLDERIGDLALAHRINHTFRRLQEYRERPSTWGDTHAGVLRRQPVAYFSAEFGIHESLPIYSGGLGVLAGDHIKSASDLGVPLVGVGLFYGQGYFRQRLDASGWQQEEYAEVDVARLPLEPAVGPDGDAIAPEIETGGGILRARVWQAAVGRRILLLLDSDVEGNTPEDRALTARLYGGDLRVRVRQELLLGIGGLKALHALGIVPGVFHLNEGHSAFAVLEAVRHCMEREGVDFETAARQVARRTVFTTHTPVPAGHDRFPSDLIDEHLAPLRDTLGISHERLMSLGRVNPDDAGEEFCMTVLGLRVSRRANAVSSLHGDVTRHMWTGLWGDRPEEDVPIGHITNGIHVPSWLAPQMQQLYDRHLSSEASREDALPEISAGIENVSDGALWETHVALKIRLLDAVRRRVLREAARRGEPAVVLEQLSHALSQDALTIGFARRVATYKRASLFLRNPDRLASLVNDPQRPIQFVIAGKGHPRDEPAKGVLRQIHELSRDSRFLGKLVFLEDYDISLGRQLVQGVDVWLNNPRRPQEASGTSGQKVLLNGGLNLSVLDGWWAEAYDGTNGFAIGSGRGPHVGRGAGPSATSEELLRVLSDEVVPLYYDRDPDGVPRGWTARMKRAIHTLGWRFNADRMVMDYVRHCYLPAAGGPLERHAAAGNRKGLRSGPASRAGTAARQAAEHRRHPRQVSACVLRDAWRDAASPVGLLPRSRAGDVLRVRLQPQILQVDDHHVCGAAGEPLEAGAQEFESRRVRSGRRGVGRLDDPPQGAAQCGDLFLPAKVFLRGATGVEDAALDTPVDVAAREKPGERRRVVGVHAGERTPGDARERVRGARRDPELRDV